MIKPTPVQTLADLAPSWDDLEKAGFVEDFLSGELDWGEPHPLAAHRNMGGVRESGLWRLLEDNDFNDLDDPGAEEFVRSWLPLRHSYLMNRLARVPIGGDGRIRVMRELSVSAETARDLRDDALAYGLGAYWTFEHLGDDRAAWGEGDVAVMLHGLVAADQIDWSGGMPRMMDYLTGDNEAELHLPDAEVELIRILCGNAVWDRDEIVSPVRRTRPEPECSREFSPA